MHNEIHADTGNQAGPRSIRKVAVIGLHFFSSTNVMRLLEVVRGARTDPRVITTVIALAVTIGKSPVLVSTSCTDGDMGTKGRFEML